MINKQKQLNQWFWKWHIIGGLICLPFMLIISVTGMLYLFKADYNQLVYNDILQVEVPANHPPSADNTAPLVSLQMQLEAVEASAEHPVTQVFLPESAKHSTGFRLHGRGHGRTLVYTNPYTGEVLGKIEQNNTLMQKIRKLHGELLLDTPGTLFVELVASWFVVLLLTGIYIWWPAKKFSLSGFFTIRTKQSRRIFWRDIHAVFGFWLSIFMLIILAGGMPWTNTFGDNLKWVQAKTDTGYPKHWRSSKGLTSQVTANNQQTISLDEIVALTQTQALKGNMNIKLPKSAKGVYTVSNRAFWLKDQHVLHIDQYTGQTIKALNWNDVGVLMELRQVFMRLHQGEYGRINWYIVLIVAFLFTISTAAGMASYLFRKPKGSWGLPKVPESFAIGYVVIAMILFLGLLFPLFGASVIIIWLGDYVFGKFRR